MRILWMAQLADTRTHPWRDRYSRNITAIKDLLTTWNSMSYVQKASPIEIARLVLGSEEIICNVERLAFQRTRGDRKDTGVETDNETGRHTKTDRDRHTKISILQE